MGLKETIKNFNEKPFETLDSIKLFKFRGTFFNPFIKYRLNRRVAWVFAIFAGLVPWMLFGFDSCIAQPVMLLQMLPQYLLGKISFNLWIQETWVAYYGKEFHYSAILIYGLMFWALSRHFDKKLGITKSKNVAYSLSLTLLSVAIFEWFWMFSYGTFQNQPWVITPRLPQFKIHLQNIMFSVCGGIGVLYMFLDSFKLDSKGNIVGRLYRFRWNIVSVVLLAATISTALLWVFYPFNVERISVPLETGDVWNNTTNFPQTLYTIDMNPTDNLNAGEWFFLENNWIHGLNTLVKALLTATICYIGLVKKTET